ncbi:uncharacterized protein O3C94_010072 [Discoglossus pictus]
MDLSKVKWTSKEYTLQEYVSKYIECFPGIIRVTEGFLGKQEIDSLSSSTVVRVHSLYKQVRVVAESKGGKLFSLPFNLKSLQFLVQGPIPVPVMQIPMTLEIILSKYNLPVTVRSSTVLSFKEKGDLQSQDELLSELTILDTYEESFLLGHPLDRGKLLIQEPIIIPMYMKELKLVLAIGYADGNDDTWNKICQTFKKQVEIEGNVTQIMLEEIFLLDKQHLTQQEPRYSTIEPIYIDISELQKNQRVQVGNKAQVTVAQKSSAQKADDKPVEYVGEPFQPKPPTYRQITEISDIPSDLHGLNIRQVCDCLVLLNMNQYVKAFLAAQIDGDLLYDLDREMMITCLGMNGLNVAKLLKFRNGWRPNLQ